MYLCEREECHFKQLKGETYSMGFSHFELPGLQFTDLRDSIGIKKKKRQFHKDRVNKSKQ